MSKNLHLGAIAVFLGFTACGLACFNLEQTLKSQGHELSEARKQLAALDQALSNQQHEVREARGAIIAAVNDKFADAQTNYQALNKQLTEMQSKLHESEAAPEARVPRFQGGQGFGGNFPGAAPDVPAADSVEGKLKADGKHWKRTQGPVVVGSYVEDTLQGRLNQPKGRGSVGKVVSLGVNGEGRDFATVDFGRGHVILLFLTEISPLDFGDDAR